MKILFLDIDGVVNSKRTDSAFGKSPMSVKGDDLDRFDWVAVGLIRNLCTVENVDIVLSSDWRHSYPYADLGRALDLPIIDHTPYLTDCRGAEIQQWLNTHPQVKHYAIVDDNSDMLSSQRDHFVQTTPENGLLYEDYRALQRILRGHLGGKFTKALFWG